MPLLLAFRQCDHYIFKLETNERITAVTESMDKPHKLPSKHNCYEN